MSADGKSILVDTSLCTACRGCQIACKQWNGLPATATKQTGTYQNPPDFSAATYKVVRFSEGKHEKTNKPYWYFFSDMCRHCVTPPCQAANVEDEIHVDDSTGAVIYTESTANIDFDTALAACPYNVPRKDETTNIMKKCTMCIDRITNGLIPACVHSCPTGAMKFGDRDKILELAKNRVEVLSKSYPLAKALDMDDVRVIYIVVDEPSKYYEYAESQM